MNTLRSAEVRLSCSLPNIDAGFPVIEECISGAFVPGAFRGILLADRGNRYLQGAHSDFQG
jgi:hypothetical protein